MTSLAALIKSWAESSSSMASSSVSCCDSASARSTRDRTSDAAESLAVASRATRKAATSPPSEGVLRNAAMTGFAASRVAFAVSSGTAWEILRTSANAAPASLAFPCSALSGVASADCAARIAGRGPAEARSVSVGLVPLGIARVLSSSMRLLDGLTASASCPSGVSRTASPPVGSGGASAVAVASKVTVSKMCFFTRTVSVFPLAILTGRGTIGSSRSSSITQSGFDFAGEQSGSGVSAPAVEALTAMDRNTRVVPSFCVRVTSTPSIEWSGAYSGAQPCSAQDDCAEQDTCS